VEGKKASILVLGSLVPDQEKWISYTRDYSHKVQINLSPIFFDNPSWVNKTQPSGMALP